MYIYDFLIPEFIHITSESFLSMNKYDFYKFEKLYSHYRIPFWCQSNVNDFTLEKIKVLRSLGCFKIAIGVECGNEEYRSVMVNKFFSNRRLKQVVSWISSNNIRLGLNSIIGLPFETKDMISETVKLNQELYCIAKNNGCPEVQFSCYVFQPYHKTDLRNFCERHNLLRNDMVGVVNQGEIVLDNPFMVDEYIYNIEKDFVKLVKDWNINMEIKKVFKIFLGLPRHIHNVLLWEAKRKL